MNIRKTSLGEIERGYALDMVEQDSVIHMLMAAEAQGACWYTTFPDLQTETIWDEPSGGTVDICFIPGRTDEFLAVQDFLPVFNASESVLVHGKRNAAGHWEVNTLMKIPFLHRFRILERNGTFYFLGATLCGGKESQDDWSQPGQVLLGKIPDDFQGPFALRPVLEGISRNHGFWQGNLSGEDVFLITGMEGAFMLHVPRDLESDEVWQHEKILDYDVSEVAFCDLDGDGKDEMAVIHPFHGDQFDIHKFVDDQWVQVYSLPIAFGHVIWGGKILGTPSFVLGYRKNEMELLLLQCDRTEPFSIKKTVIDEGGGPSQIRVLHQPDREIILAANRQFGPGMREIAVYELFN